MAEPIAYLNGTYVDPSELTIAINDTGFVMGVTVSERLRTFGGQLFRWEAHLDRLSHSLEVIGLDFPGHRQELLTVAEKLVKQNHALLDPADDLGVCILVTPGSSRHDEPKPTICLYTYPLPFQDWLPWYRQGAKLIVSKVRQVPANCWPGDLKCRSRMHYYLADREAAEQQPGARALLLDQEGYVSEASTANLLLYRAGEGLISPPASKTLPGISLATVRELAKGLSLDWKERDLEVADLEHAEEIMLCSTSPCIWAVTEFNCEPVGNGQPGPIVKQLLAAWGTMVGLEIEAQASQFSSRTGP